MTKTFSAKIIRRLRKPLLLFIAVAVVAEISFSFILPNTPLFHWIDTFFFVLIVLILGFWFYKEISTTVNTLAQVAEELSPGIFDGVSLEKGGLQALSTAVSEITTEIRNKEQTWMGDMERRNEAVRLISRNLQEQAASFEAALNSMNLPVCLFDANGHVLQANQFFSQVLGIAVDGLKRQNFLSIVAEAMKIVSEPQELIKAAESIKQKPSQAADFSFPLKSGIGRLRLYCTPVFGDLSSLLGIIISTGDESSASAVENLKSEFISTVSHELRTPLTAIKGALGLVLGGACGPVPAPIQEMLGIASSNTDRLIQLVNDILDIFRMEAGKLTLSPVSISAASLIEKACENLRPLREKKGVLYDFQLDKILPNILADPERTQVVFEKIISNAIKYSPANSQVRIIARHLSDQPQFVQISVQDFGKGIPQGAQARIFEKFEQAESTLTREHQGSGLGLAICRAIVEGHGGRIWVSSEEGKGSSFHITLPVAQPSLFVAATPSASAVLSHPAIKPHYLVMVVDDEPDARKIISSILQSDGHFVVEVNNPAQVTDLAIRHRPDVITLDMLMPEVDGLNVLYALKTNDQTRRIPVICISVSEEMSARAMKMGVVECLKKPVPPATLLQSVHSACQKAPSGKLG
ncbi:MAG: hypothetical protein A3F68_07050 [Acidobacteria bacterium RIFCSPLOWO2_12_FULL_54_10]|nr:MAG: hypothetical protein A3F68_07050 [Acidobacteria bacterium RIFCSPLOWO2_12_FULL_54_10]